MTTCIRTFLIGLATLLLPAAAGAQLAAPGLGLNRPDFFDDFAGSSSYYLGQEALLKGVKTVTFTYGRRVGAIQGGVWPQTAGSALNPASIITGLGGTTLSSTLLPPFASGAAVRDNGGNGSFIRAMLFEPDQVKRKGKNGKFRLTLKQKKYVGIKRGAWTNPAMTYNTYSNMGAVEGCKAQADFRWDENKGEGSRRFKVSCKSGPGADSIADYFENQLGLKPKAKFDLEQVTTN
jgi:hypothetical protein